MSKRPAFEDIDAVILCGGEGRRIRPVAGDLPKPMIEIGGRPFLDILIDYAARFGFRRFILCIGYGAEFIKRYYKGGKGNYDIVFSEEKALMGTGGCIKNASSKIGSDIFLVMNGDSFCDVDLGKFLEFHTRKKAYCSIVVSPESDSSDYGSIILGESQRINAFSEKSVKGDGFVNGGIYLFRKEILSEMPEDKNFSLENDFFPVMVKREFYGYLAEGGFIDIGTPERLKQAEKILRRTLWISG
ncbi:MAG: nucleotidyltransferase family protein [Candidatus Omnitrophica bacterium]|nr:nucleotidyltransferase family protein [Candidatus Omnitrophota bacterium]